MFTQSCVTESNSHSRTMSYATMVFDPRRHDPNIYGYFFSPGHRCKRRFSTWLVITSVGCLYMCTKIVWGNTILHLAEGNVHVLGKGIHVAYTVTVHFCTKSLHHVGLKNVLATSTLILTSTKHAFVGFAPLNVRNLSPNQYQSLEVI